MSLCIHAAVRRVGQLPALAIAVAYGSLVLAHADALRAAGITGEAPPNAGAITKFVSAVTGNLLWILGTLASLAILVVGALFFFGYSRAPDLAIRIGVGALILISAGGIAG